MGGRIEQVLALAGARVTLTDVSAGVAQKNYHRLIVESRDFVTDGLFPEGAGEILEKNLWAASSLAEAVADADFIEEPFPRFWPSSTTSWHRSAPQPGRTPSSAPTPPPFPSAKLPPQ